MKSAIAETRYGDRRMDNRVGKISGGWHERGLREPKPAAGSAVPLSGPSSSDWRLGRCEVVKYPEPVRTGEDDDPETMGLTPTRTPEEQFTELFTDHAEAVRWVLAPHEAGHGGADRAGLVVRRDEDGQM